MPDSVGAVRILVPEGLQGQTNYPEGTYRDWASLSHFYERLAEVQQNLNFAPKWTGNQGRA